MTTSSKVLKTADQIWPAADRAAYYANRNAGIAWLVVSSLASLLGLTLALVF